MQMVLYFLQASPCTIRMISCSKKCTFIDRINYLIKFKYQILSDFCPSGSCTGGFNFCQSNILTLYPYFYSLLHKVFLPPSDKKQTQLCDIQRRVFKGASSARQDIVKMLTF